MIDVEDNAFWLFIWTLVAGTILLISYMIYLDNQSSKPGYERIQIECIHAHGVWGPMQGTSSENTCNHY